MIEVRTAELKDIPALVEIHQRRFSSFFLTTLGTTFLRVFYTAFLKFPGILLVLTKQNKIEGFAAGSLDNKGFFKKLLSNNLLGFMKAGIILVFTNPLAIKRLGTNAGKSEKATLEYSELLSIATNKNNEGFGRILLEAFELDVLKNQKRKLPISLTTDFDNNEKAVTFYKEAGYDVYEVFFSYNDRKMYRFIKNI